MPLFNVMKLCEDGALEPYKPGWPYHRETADPYVFECGKRAAEHAKTLSTLYGGKWQPRPVQIEDHVWKSRERARLDSGHYQCLPWDQEDWFCGSEHYSNHYAHVSQQPGRIAYTESREKGAQDIQTPMRPGRYLKQFFGDVLTDDEIERWVGAFAAETDLCDLQFARTPDEIEDVYTSGPNSCMSHDASSFQSSIHPCRVYGAGDLAIAYIERDDRITARAVCWPDKKIYQTIYGDGDRLRAAFDFAGYNYSSDASAWSGARLLKVENGPGYVVPYLDVVGQARDDGDHLVITPRGVISCGSTCGLDREMSTCDSCGALCEDDDTAYVRGCGNWCETCREEEAVYCERTWEWYHHGDAVQMANGTWVSESWFINYGTTCDNCGRNFDASETVWCEDCSETRCGDCGPCEHSEDDETEDTDHTASEATPPGRNVAGTLTNYRAVRVDADEEEFMLAVSRIARLTEVA